MKRVILIPKINHVGKQTSYRVTVTAVADPKKKEDCLAESHYIAMRQPLVL